MEDIIRKRLEALHQDLDSLNNEAAALALGGEARDRQVVATSGAIEALESILEQAAPPSPSDLGPIRIASEGGVLGALRGYSVQEVGTSPDYMQVTLRVLATHEDLAWLTAQVAERTRLTGRVEAPTEAEEAHALLRKAGSEADDTVALGDREAPAPRIVIAAATKRVLDRSAGTTFRIFQGEFGSYNIVADPALEPGQYRIEGRA